MRIITFLMVIFLLFGILGYAVFLRSRGMGKAYEVQALRQHIFDVRNEIDLLRVETAERLRLPVLVASARRHQIDLELPQIGPAEARNHLNSKRARAR